MQINGQWQFLNMIITCQKEHENLLQIAIKATEFQVYSLPLVNTNLSPKPNTLVKTWFN